MLSELLAGWHKDVIVKSLKDYKNVLQVGLGTIAKGVFGNEPILSPANLEEDLHFLYKHSIDTAVIFRLGGLNEKYLSIIMKYVH